MPRRLSLHPETTGCDGPYAARFGPCFVPRKVPIEKKVLYLPEFLNQNTMGYNLLKGKKGLIFGALNEQSIAWKVAERAVEEGAEIVLTNTAVSIRMGTINQLAEKCNTIVVPADATSGEDLENLIDKTM